MLKMLSSRATDLKELMDDHQCDLRTLYNTYHHFKYINPVVSRWKHVYKRYLLPLMTDKSHRYTILDVGFGGGDISLKLLEWAKQDGVHIKITAIELEPRAITYAQKHLDVDPDSIDFVCVSTRDLVAQGRRFDFVISNHVLHHLHREDVQALLLDAELLATLGVVFNDLYRSAIAYYVFKVATSPVFGDNFIVHDGLVSIRRSFTTQELKAIAPGHWQVKNLLPYRILLLCVKERVKKVR